MKTEQTNIRLDADLVAALERMAREEGIDRPAAIKRLLELSLREWEITHALDRYRRGQLPAAQKQLPREQGPIQRAPAEHVTRPSSPSRRHHHGSGHCAVVAGGHRAW